MNSNHPTQLDESLQEILDPGDLSPQQIAAIKLLVLQERITEMQRLKGFETPAFIPRETLQKFCDDRIKFLEYELEGLAANTPQGKETV